MKKETKNLQLQIRVSAKEKARIINQADKAGLGISEWVLMKLFPRLNQEFEALLIELQSGKNEKYTFAELNDFFTKLTSDEFIEAVSNEPSIKLKPYFMNYLAAMIEISAHNKGVVLPEWIKEIPPLEDPVFGTDLKSLRLHLLLNSPPPFRKRNIFIDSSVGDRV